MRRRARRRFRYGRPGRFQSPPTGSWPSRILIGSVLLLALAADGAFKPRLQENLEKIARSDSRIEFVARALCKARGIDPDYQGAPYAGPVWEIFIVQARDFLAMDDAADAYASRRPGRQGPPD